MPEGLYLYDVESSQIGVDVFLRCGPGNANDLALDLCKPWREDAIEQGHVMAGGAFCFSHKEVEPIDLICAHGCLIASHVSVEAAVERRKGADIGADGIHYFECIDAVPVLFGEGGGKHAPVGAILPETFYGQ